MKQIKEYNDYLITTDGKISDGGKRNGAINGRKGREKTSKVILDTSNGIFYTGINEAAYVLGLKPTTLKARLNGQSKNFTTFKYV